MTHQPADDHAISERQAQARLERMLAARRAAEAARSARFRPAGTPRSQFRADAKASLLRHVVAPPTRLPTSDFTWGDAAVFLLPAAALGVLLLIAHWAGWLS